MNFKNEPWKDLGLISRKLRNDNVYVGVEKIFKENIKKSCVSKYLKKIADNFVVAVKLRIKPPKRRSPTERLKARLYYRKNRSKIRTQRRRYLRTHKSILKHRKMFMRYKPKWFKKPKPPKHIKPKKIITPKRK